MRGETLKSLNWEERKKESLFETFSCLHVCRYFTRFYLENLCESGERDEPRPAALLNTLRLGTRQRTRRFHRISPLERDGVGKTALFYREKYQVAWISFHVRWEYLNDICLGVSPFPSNAVSNMKRKGLFKL